MTGLPAAFLAAPIAHRGLHDGARRRPENSRAAVRAAAEGGYGVEIDVQLSADGEAMVFHDPTLDRMTGEIGPVGARSAAALSAIGLRGGDETIPTLAEILALATTPLLIELKDQSGRFDGSRCGPLEARVAELAGGARAPVAVMSFNPAAMREMARRAPDAPRGLVAGGPERFLGAEDPDGLVRLDAFEAVGAAFASYDHRALPSEATAAIRARGVPVLSWTIRSPAEEAEARRHSDNVTFEGYAPAFAR